MSHIDDLVQEIVKLKAKLKVARQKTRLWKNRVDEAAEYIEDYEETKAENKRLRETNRKLNRRCQLAEKVADDNIEKCKRAGVSFGRALSNYGYLKQQEEIADLNEQLRELLIDAEPRKAEKEISNGKAKHD